VPYGRFVAGKQVGVTDLAWRCHRAGVVFDFGFLITFGFGFGVDIDTQEEHVLFCVIYMYS
jgi:hypothetical protein